jgi:EpsI family protein
VGADHLIYGWIFFGVVISLLLFIGSRWRQDDGATGLNSASDVDASQAAGARREGAPRNRWAAVAAAFALMAVWQPLSGRVDSTESSAATSIPRITDTNGWIPDPDAIAMWRPDLSGARAELRQTFVKDGHRVGLYVAFYRGQTPETKAITSTNQIVSTNNRLWRQITAGAVSTTVRDSTLDVRSGVVTGQNGRLALWQWYWVDAHLTSNDYVAKFYQAWAVLERHPDATAWVIVYTETGAGEADVRPVLQAFTADMMPAIDASLRKAASE